MATNVTEPSPATLYAADLTPTLAELKLLARLRQIGGMCIVDSDSMTIWRAGPAEYCNGKRGAVVQELPFVLPIDT